MSKNTITLEVITGYGEDSTYHLEVAYWARFLRGANGKCAFCNGYPEGGPFAPPIYQAFVTRFGDVDSEESCPVCKGEAT